MESPLAALKKFLIGALLGIISFVPGVSGVVLAVTLGVYERIVEDIADIFHKIRQDFNFLMVIGLGLLFGMVIASFGLKYVIDNYTIAAMMLFLGMILGQIPQLWKYTLPEVKPSKTDITALVIGVLIMCLFLVFRVSEDVEVGHDVASILLMLLIGVIYAIAHIAPGISGSTLLLAIGLLYLPMEVISSFDFVLLLPFAIGTAVGLIGFARTVHYAISNYRKTTYMMIFGLTIGSFLVVFKEAYSAYGGAEDILFGAIALAVGILVSLWFSRVGQKTSAEYSVK
ncbi:MAG: DUF368 domain-containing protein [Methanomassiliicoccaceae archaeon]|nr:DUF368 domain-containing protein [Methanomassiliicoccaceae archaeon]